MKLVAEYAHKSTGNDDLEFQQQLLATFFSSILNSI